MDETITYLLTYKALQKAHFLNKLNQTCLAPHSKFLENEPFNLRCRKLNGQL
jgi:hypothetical protein